MDVPGNAGLVEENHFIDGDASTVNGTALSVSGSLVANHNIFENLGPLDHPDVYATNIVQTGTLQARFNQFLQPGLAAQSSNHLFDARWNWWGDGSGPYNGSFNPEGQGSEVGTSVEFIPWLSSDPDSSDTGSIAPEHRNISTASSFRLSAFPNPFNSSVTLVLEVTSPGNYTVILFDITGREARKVFEGNVNVAHEIQFDASSLPSGVYFAQLNNDKSSLAVTKLLLLK